MLKLEFMPEATRKIFDRLKGDPLLSGFTLVGGTALALQIGHRMSEGLNFNMFGEDLPKRRLDKLLADLDNEGASIESLIPAEKKIQHKINTGHNLEDTIQDYLINGAKVTFHSRSDRERPKIQIDYLKSANRISILEGGFEVLGLHGLFVMKSIVGYDRARSRDLFDLMILIKDHGFTLEDSFEAIATHQPARNKDPEHLKSLATGIIPLDKMDEGFSSISLGAQMKDIYDYFKLIVKDYEIRTASALLQDENILKMGKRERPLS